MTLLAIPVVDANLPIANQVRAAFDAGADLVELRVDLIDDLDAVEDFLRAYDSRRIIVTLRSTDEGGAWDGSDAEKISILERLGLLLPGYIDCERALWQRSANLRQKIGLVCDVERNIRTTADEKPCGLISRPTTNTDRAKNRLIISMHDFQGMDALQNHADALLAAPGIAKIAVTPRDATDSLRLLNWLHINATQKDIIAIGMGDAGVCTRVLAKKCGAFLSFATMDDAQSSAPGQISLATMLDQYRWREIGEDTRVFSVLGWPVAHSRSPKLHNAAMKLLGIDGVYLPLPVSPTYEAFDAFMASVEASPALGFDGFSVTIPHKEHASRWLASRGFEQSPLCTACGAVNTLIRTNTGWRGENTDALGALQALATALRGEQPIRPSDDQALSASAGLQRRSNPAESEQSTQNFLTGRTVAILGAGGAARAIIAGAQQAGASVIIYNRTLEKAAALAQHFNVAAEPWDQRGETAADILINCTSVGMTPHVDDSPLPTTALRSNMVVLDTVYTPEQTRLLQDANVAGCTTVTGVEMFLRQAREQIQLWHGRDIDVADLRSALL